VSKLIWRGREDADEGLGDANGDEVREGEGNEDKKAPDAAEEEKR
jgi:hypothetical protein